MHVCVQLGVCACVIGCACIFVCVCMCEDIYIFFSHFFASLFWDGGLLLNLEFIDLTMLAGPGLQTQGCRPVLSCPALYMATRNPNLLGKQIANCGISLPLNSWSFYKIYFYFVLGTRFHTVQAILELCVHTRCPWTRDCLLCCSSDRIVLLPHHVLLRSAFL